VQKIVGEVFLDHVTLVTQANDEVVDIVSRVDLHYMPKYRLAADFDHGFGLEVRFLTDARAIAPRKNDSFHDKFNSGEKIQGVLEDRRILPIHHHGVTEKIQKKALLYLKQIGPNVHHFLRKTAQANLLTSETPSMFG
jgi:hypothetical protein